MPPIQLKQGKCTKLLPAASFEDVKEEFEEEIDCYIRAHLQLGD
jgi:hypothetical protein